MTALPAGRHRRPWRPRLPATREEARRREVRRQLAAFELLRGPHLKREGLTPAPDRAARLAQALTGLGPTFAAFGRHLATRPDLFPAADCLALAAIPDRAEPSPAAAVAALLEGDLGAPAAELFAAFDPAPFESRPLWQSHRARLADGTAAVVRVIHPELAEGRGAWARDLELLPALAEALADGPWADWRGLPWATAADDFAASLPDRIDLAREAAALAAVADETADFPVLAVPRVVRRLSGLRVLTLEALPGFGEDGKDSKDGRDGKDAERTRARRATMAWLRLALMGGHFPVDLAASDVAYLTDGRVAFLGGFGVGLPTRSKVQLWDYLIAAAVEDPDRICTLLLDELAEEGAGGPAGSAGELRARLRQVVPFRDGAFRDGGRGDTLAEHLFIHWRLAAERGHRPGPRLLRFYRGLAAVALATRPLAPEADVLAEGFQDLRMSVAMAGARRAVSPGGLAEAADRYAAAFVELPRGLDRWLRRGARPEAASGPAGERRDGRDRAALVAALGLALAAAILLTHHFVAQGVLGPWGERLGTLAVLLLAGALFAAAGRAA